MGLGRGVQEDRTIEQECPECHGSKHILTDKGFVRCKCLIEEQYAREAERAGVPEYLKDQTYKSWMREHKDCKKLALFVAQWAKDVSAGKHRIPFCLSGRSNSGKRTLAYLVLRHCIERDKTARIVTMDDLVQDRFKDDEDLMSEVLYADVLCVRLGVEMEHKMNSMLLEKVHFNRKEAKRGTFYTTRVDAELFEGRYGPVLWKAFWEAGNVAVWDMKMGRQIT